MGWVGWWCCSYTHCKNIDLSVITCTQLISRSPSPFFCLPSHAMPCHAMTWHAIGHLLAYFASVSSQPVDLGSTLVVWLDKYDCCLYAYNSSLKYEGCNPWTMGLIDGWTQQQCTALLCSGLWGWMKKGRKKGWRKEAIPNLIPSILFPPLCLSDYRPLNVHPSMVYVMYYSRSIDPPPLRSGPTVSSLLCSG